MKQTDEERKLYGYFAVRRYTTTWDIRPYLSRKISYTGRIKYIHFPEGVEMAVEITYLEKGRKPDPYTVGYLWWKKTVQPPRVDNPVTKWCYSDEFKWFDPEPKVVIVGCSGCSK